MKIYLQKNGTGEEIYGTFTPEITIDTNGLLLMMYCADNYTFIGDNAEIKTDQYNQVFLTNLHCVMLGSMLFNEKTYNAQIGCYISEANYKLDFAVIYVEDTTGEINYNYSSGNTMFGGSKVTVKILDYNNYCQLVNEIGNKPVSFKRYVLRTIFNISNAQNELDFQRHNETSYFNEKNTDKEEDFITVNGMSVYLEEVKKNYYKVK